MVARISTRRYINYSFLTKTLRFIRNDLHQARDQTWNIPRDKMSRFIIALLLCLPSTLCGMDINHQGILKSYTHEYPVMHQFVVWKYKLYYCHKFAHIDIADQSYCSCPFLGCTGTPSCFAGGAICSLKNPDFDYHDLKDSDCSCLSL